MSARRSTTRGPLARRFRQAQGKEIRRRRRRSINQYNLAQGLLKAGLDPAKDVQWTVNVPQPTSCACWGRPVDVTDLAYQFGLFAQNNKWGPIIANGDQIAPNAAIATFAVRKDYLARNRDAVIRWSMAYLQGVKEFNAAAKDPSKHPEIIEILAKNTALNKPELVRAIAPNWGLHQRGRRAGGRLDHGHAGLLEREVFQFRGEEVTQEQLFDLSVAKEPRPASIGKSRSVRERAGSSHASYGLVGPRRHVGVPAAG